MNWKFWEPRLETRASATDLAVDTLISRATGGASDIASTAAVETAAGLWGRAFASATVEPDTRQTAAITPAVLEMIGRQLIRRGEVVFQIVVSGGAVVLLPAASFTVTGGPESWDYEIHVSGPSQSFTRQLPAASVLHFRYATDPKEPWRGRSPVSTASVSADLLAYLEKRLSEEASGVHGAVIPTPVETGGTVGGSLESKIAGLKGQLALVPSAAQDWQGKGSGIGSANDWQPRRLGMDPPQSEIVLREDAALSILSACGVPVELVSKGEGTASREAWRRFLHGSVDPVARLVAQELSEKLETSVSLDLSSLHASDVQGRARAFQSLVGGGMPIGEAAAVTGLLDQH